jgi:hypothetical protein
MTEAEWLSGEDPIPMLDFLRGRASDRKFRLFSTACCRRIWPLLAHDTHRRAVERAEQFADGLTTLAKMQSASRSAGRHRDRYKTEYDQMLVGPRNLVFSATHPDAYSAAYDASSDKFWVVKFWGYVVGLREESDSTDSGRLIQEIFGNPFRLELIEPAWLTPAVKQIAQAAYDERILPAGNLDPARIAILADALEEAGCMNRAILGHLRSPNSHVRGCWLVDSVLGRE